MDYVKERTHVIDHPRFLEAGPHARDLWEWGMKYAGRHETDGEIPMAAVLASPWGYGGKKNIVAANKLVEVGLWDRTDRGFRVCRWSEQGNLTKAQIEAERQAARDRMKKRRTPLPGGVVPETTPLVTGGCSPEHRPNFGRSSPDVPTSTSPSLPGRNDLPVSRGGERERGSRTLDPAEPLTDARAAYVAAVSGNTGEALDAGSVWRNFVNDRIARSVLFASEAAIDGGWRKWVDTEAKYAKDRRKRARGAEITKQPFDPEAPWLKAASGDSE